MKILTQIRRVMFVLPGVALAMFVFFSVPARTASDDDAAALYKAKCVACHGPAAEKKFDPTKPDAVLADIILKGVKSEKPPNMPAYGDKGITAEQAAALVAFMKAQRK